MLPYYALFAYALPTLTPLLMPLPMPLLRVMRVVRDWDLLLNLDLDLEVLGL